MALATSLIPATPLVQTNTLNPLGWTDDQILEKVYITHVHTAERYDVESLFNVTSNIIKRATAVADSVAVKVIKLQFMNLCIDRFHKHVCLIVFHFFCRLAHPLVLLKTRLLCPLSIHRSLNSSILLLRSIILQHSIHYYYSFLLDYYFTLSLPLYMQIYMNLRWQTFTLIVELSNLFYERICISMYS